ncbi:thiamine phosphate synthase [Vineibacter terrae]|uniref:Thiamine-phosphate synthase n=1 Tax=Vineibacter terrae TaxID=2586908 RepID=A0A5C8P9B8_9HYPH|nr:thiamine phosphate synthase [Vineibacter terrae]TXL70412.1 thiamine phosphate synthase [Vineibacter terrae]
MDTPETARCRLYLITPPSIAHPALFADELRGALDGGDVAVLQLRLKEVPDDVVARTADVLRPICQQRGVAFIMNDRPDLALKLDCDGVHVGQQDAPYADARRLLGPDRIVGVTCKASRHLAMEAAEAGADYVAFGAFFTSSTKEATTPASPDILAWWSEIMTVPSVAIGGITADNCRPLVEAGADFLAVANGVWAHPDGPTQAVRRFNAVFDACFQ